MSGQATGWAVSQKTGSPSAKAVLLSIANYCNKDGTTWLSQRLLADESEQSVDSVQRRLADLSERGLLRRIPLNYGGRKSVEFFILAMSELFDQPIEKIASNVPSGFKISGLPDTAICGNELPQPLPQSAGSVTATVRQQVVPKNVPKYPESPSGDSAREDLFETGKMRPYPIGWVPKLSVAIEKLGLSEAGARDLAEHFRAHHLARGTKFKDWPQAWITWVHNDKKFSASRGSRHHQQPAPGEFRILRS